MPYLEIYPIENSADKIAKQLDAVLEAKPTMYAKTKDRYKKLMYSLLQSVEKISNILEEESLVPASNNSDEFDELSNEDEVGSIELSTAIESVKYQVDSYTHFTSNSNSSADSKMSNRDIIHRFATVISSASFNVFKLKEATECAIVIDMWFQARFTPYIKNPKFRYSINQIPVWITYIIILYGKYQSMNEQDKFVDIFTRFRNDISTNLDNCWAVPYEVYDLMKNVKPDYFTMNAVVIGDILMEEKYHLLTEQYLKGSDVFLDCSPVAAVVKEKNPTLLPKIRTRISKQAELIDECNLTDIHKGDNNLE